MEVMPQLPTSSQLLQNLKLGFLYRMPPVLEKNIKQSQSVHCQGCSHQPECFLIILKGRNFSAQTQGERGCIPVKGGLESKSSPAPHRKKGICWVVEK